MKIELTKIGKRFNRHWIFKEIDFTFNSGSQTVIKGTNGSGKSTLLKIISAAELPSSGKINYQKSGQNIGPNAVFKELSYTAPYIDLPSELNLIEICNFHLKFKHFINHLSIDHFAQLIQLNDAKNKVYRNYSSGMKQRLKLGLALCSNTSVLLLDEPCSNLDNDGRKLYRRLLSEYGKGRTVIIASNNDPDEMNNIENSLLIKNYQIQS